MLAKIKTHRVRLIALARKYPRRTVVGSTGLLLLGFLLLWGYVPVVTTRSLAFSYSNQNCVRDLTLLPSIHDVPKEANPALHKTDPLTINGYPLIARKTCINLNAMPQENTVVRLQSAPFGNPLFKKRYKIEMGSYPAVSSEVLKETLSVKEPLSFSLDQHDQVFSYKLGLNELETPCSNVTLTVECEVSGLALAHGAEYRLSLKRYYGATEVSDLMNKTVTTVTPVEIVGGSVVKDQIIYAVPSELRISTNKDLSSVEARLEKIEEGGDRVQVDGQARVEGKEVVFTLGSELPRISQYEIVFSRLIANDKGELSGAVSIPFSTSGSPVVTGSSAGAYSLGQNQQIILTFDQDVMADQDFSKLVSLKASGAGVRFAAALQGNKLTIKPSAALPFCSSIMVQVDNGLKSSFGVAGNSAWTFNSRTVCHTTVTIGYSAKGKPITAWRFGTGASKIMYLGSIHGNEKGTKYLLDGWVKDLEVNVHKIPEGRSIIVVPNINPDGLASNDRKNANGVDLNRNFPANNWKADVTIPGGQLVTNGGGTAALSEPEAKAIANFIRSEAPRLVLSYHSIASIVAGNDSGDANSLAAQYAGSSRYRNMSGQATAVFNYDTTGALEDWLHDKLGIPCILIELGSDSDPQTSRNNKAMWSMAQIP